MGFRPANLAAHFTTFNSIASCDFIELYNSAVESEIIEHNSEPKHRTFAPSSFRCDRLNWFRLRGVQPDAIEVPDLALNFTADIGTACHQMIQTRLERVLGADWVDVSEHLKSINPDYEYTVEKSGHEWLIEILNPPVRFACDGIINFKGKRYLLEIKTSDFSSFTDLTQPKEKHVDQIKCYATLLNLHDVLVLYVDRQYGGLKCFEVHVSDAEMDAVRRKMQHVLDMVEAYIAPEGLPKGDPSCLSNMCPYYKVCKQW